MAFQEKLAWIACLTTLVAAAWLFSPMLTAGEPTAARLVAAVVVQTMLATILATAAAATSPKAAGQPPDEREKSIDQSATRNGYLVLVCLIVGVIAGGLFLGWTAAGTALAALAAFMAAEIVRYASQIVSYRRGA